MLIRKRTPSRYINTENHDSLIPCKPRKFIEKDRINAK